MRQPQYEDWLNARDNHRELLFDSYPPSEINDAGLGDVSALVLPLSSLALGDDFYIRRKAQREAYGYGPIIGRNTGTTL